MGPVSGDQDVIAGAKLALVLAFNAQTRRAGEQQNPLVMSLTMGFIRRRGLTGRYDPLDAHAPAPKELGENLLVCARRNILEQIDHNARLRSGQGPGAAS